MSPQKVSFNTLKTELAHHRRYLTRAEAQQGIFEYLKVFDNRQKRHSAIDCQSRFGYEKQYQNSA